MDKIEAPLREQKVEVKQVQIIFKKKTIKRKIFMEVKRNLTVK